jgi:hypothetical protein
LDAGIEQSESYLIESSLTSKKGPIRINSEKLLQESALENNIQKPKETLPPSLDYDAETKTKVPWFALYGFADSPLIGM